MYPSHTHRSRWIRGFLSLLFTLVLGACVDDPVSPRPPGVQAGVGFRCDASVVEETIECHWTGKQTLTRGPLQNIIVGGQGPT